VCLADGAIAQLGERLLCKQEVIGSIPIGSTSLTPLQCLPKTSQPVCLRRPGAFARCLKIRKFCFDAKFSSELILFGNVAFANVNQLDERNLKLLEVIWSSEQAHMVNALAVEGDERRGSLR
jgi:hypothetical protein